MFAGMPLKPIHDALRVAFLCTAIGSGCSNSEAPQPIMGAEPPGAAGLQEPPQDPTPPQLAWLGQHPVSSGLAPTDMIYLGLAEMERSALHLDERQAVTVLEMLTIRRGFMFLLGELGSVLGQTLDAQQNAFVVAKMQKAAPEDMAKPIGTERIEPVLERLVAIAGPGSDQALTLPDPLPEFTPYLRATDGPWVDPPAFFLVEEQLQRSCPLNAEQARRIIPVLRAFLELLPEVPPHEILLRTLDEEQKTYLDQVLVGFAAAGHLDVAGGVNLFEQQLRERVADQSRN